MTRLLSRARPLAGVLALLVGLTFAAPPAFSAEATAQPLAAARAAAMVEALPAAAVVQATPATPTAAKPVAASTDKPFFKTTTGIVSLVLLGGALGAMAYSFSNGRVKSPAK